MLQINSLEDRTILDKQQWDIAVKFMEEAVKNKLTQGNHTHTSDTTKTCMGLMQMPGQWLWAILHKTLDRVHSPHY